MLAGGVFVRPPRNVRLCTANKRFDQEAPFYAYVCTLTRYVRLSIFVQIVDVLDLHFKGKKCESSTLGTVIGYAIISQTATNRTSIAIVN